MQQRLQQRDSAQRSTGVKVGDGRPHGSLNPPPIGSSNSLRREQDRVRSSSAADRHGLLRLKAKSAVVGSLVALGDSTLQSGSRETKSNALSDDAVVESIWYRSEFPEPCYRVMDSDMVLDFISGPRALVRLPLIVPTTESRKKRGDSVVPHVRMELSAMCNRSAALRVSSESSELTASTMRAEQSLSQQQQQQQLISLDPSSSCDRIEETRTDASQLDTSSVDWHGLCIATESGRLWRIGRPCSMAEQRRADALFKLSVSLRTPGASTTSTSTVAAAVLSASSCIHPPPPSSQSGRVLSSSASDSPLSAPDELLEVHTKADADALGMFAWFHATDVVTDLVQLTVKGFTLRDDGLWKREREYENILVHVLLLLLPYR